MSWLLWPQHCCWSGQPIRTSREVMINHNVDLGDAWEWAEQEAYPREFAHLAFQLGMNYIVYAMTH